MSLSDRVRAAIERRRFNFATEAELQRGVARVLEEEGISFAREVVLSPRDRVDFLASNTAIEVKVGDATAALLRQLARYAQHDRVEELVVVASRARLTALPPSIGGKPLTCIRVGGLT